MKTKMRLYGLMVWKIVYNKDGLLKILERKISSFFHFGELHLPEILKLFLSTE